MPRRQSIHERILSIAITCDESDDSVLVTGVTFYRNRQSLDDSEGFSPGFTAEAAAGTHEFELSQTIPPPTVIRLVSTFQA